MHGVTGFIESAALLVCAAFVLVTICSRIGVPSIVGYILAGIVIGPAGLGLIAETTWMQSLDFAKRSLLTCSAILQSRSPIRQ